MPCSSSPLAIRSQLWKFLFFPICPYGLTWMEKSKLSWNLVAEPQSACSKLQKTWRVLNQKKTFGFGFGTSSLAWISDHSNILRYLIYGSSYITHHVLTAKSKSSKALCEALAEELVGKLVSFEALLFNLFSFLLLFKLSSFYLPHPTWSVLISTEPHVVGASRVKLKFWIVSGEKPGFV